MGNTMIIINIYFCAFQEPSYHTSCFCLMGLLDRLITRPSKCYKFFRVGGYKFAPSKTLRKLPTEINGNQ